MKNLRFLTLGLALITLLFTACKKDDNNGGEQAPQKLTLEKSAVTVKQTESAIVRITAGNGGYKVESADKNIAIAAIEQNNVKITAIAEGKTTLTVSDAKGQKAAIAVTVESNIAPGERLSVEKQELTLVNGESEPNRILNAEHKGTINLSFTISPTGSVSITVEDRIVNGNPEGKNLRVKALKVGTAQITVKDNTNNQNISFKVIVTAAELTIEKTTAEVETEATVEVRINTGNPDYTVTSSASNIATAEIKKATPFNHLDPPHKAVFIKGVAAGTATISLKDSQNKTVAITITVKSKDDIFEVDSNGVVTLKAGAKAEGDVKIPNNGTTIGARAFARAEFTSVDFNNITTIEGNAFLGASKLTAVTMHKVTNIGNIAFANCKALKTITVKTSTPPTIQRLTFNTTGITVYVPKGAKAAYEANANWKKLGTIKELN
ncbi:bacterial group 2 Ig-like protein [Capnocytophaga ochracea F0287]|uniref:Bacterial group 2 Ig-like protein n=1 Tax=Capnocytophaga ochracea F0287 TaxID=873517 RepID=E4MRX3_CAPOC|nr:leucine-rich repeat domain-containing protein [Capnocytophaga ochracea]EFS97535.1 bacterial group 2 Ig-like protein [Capnocytophaga ochracea F0287]EJF44994.1 leucine rich repeat protein [Capnocytophaga ochracea str. Holt 25]UEB44108.1 leucine-rich repeat domain-containing protein [Capnocytophaga ochracea]